ncbi:MAG TPA: S1-like domain-containing RNA-binding protein [Geobacteraceae bacterium]|nr:S1-like domain-containing RNA-binding protein [Geobacteraceae bacterium]
MLEIGKYNQLEVIRMSPTGATLASEAGEILLPRKNVPAGTKQGDTVNVFIYRDSNDRLIATTRAPRVQVDEFAVLEVKDTGPVGAFLDWGLEKDLLVPFSEQPLLMKKGERHLVRVYLDNSGRIAASAKLGKFLEGGDIPFKAGDEVDLMIHAFTDLGAKVIINGRYAGLLFRNEIYGNPAPGARFKGYVRKVRDDGKIDVTLKKPGHDVMEGSKERVLKTLAATGGFLPLGDKSPPELIGDVLKMSKKTFKKAIGSLYKDGFIELTENGIKLRNT